MTNTIDLEYFAEHGHLKMEDAQNLHAVMLRFHGITDGDVVIADWNRRDPAAPWGSGIVGKYLTELTDLVVAFMGAKVAEVTTREDDVLRAIRACPAGAKLRGLTYGGYEIADGEKQLGTGVTAVEAWLDAAAAIARNVSTGYPCRECGKGDLGIPDAICPICGGE